MNRLRKQIVLALLGVGGICSAWSEAQACGGRGGSGGYRQHRVSYARPIYPQQHPQPFVQQRPWVGPPATIHPQMVQQQPQQQVLTANGQAHLPPTVRRVGGGPVNGSQQVPGQFQQGGVQPQQAVQRPMSGQAVTGQAESSALESLGGMQPQVAQRPAANSLQQQPQQLSQQPAQQPQSDPMSEAQQSALQALGGISDEGASQATTQFTEAAQPAAAGVHVGRWQATLGNGSIVQLHLQADGSFVWTATTSGKTSSFEGNYSLENGALTLVRSSDNQKLAGSLTPTSNGGVNFKLNGAKDAGLSFSRS